MMTKGLYDLMLKLDELQTSADELVTHYENELIKRNDELLAQRDEIKRLRTALEQSRVEFDALCDYFEHTDAPMPADPRRITYRDLLRRDHPDDVDPIFEGGCHGCPSNYGYCDMEDPISHCTTTSCRACWDRRVGE